MVGTPRGDGYGTKRRTRPSGEAALLSNRVFAGGRVELAIVALCFALLLQAIGALLGQDANWDAFNYHFSSAANWLRGKPWNDYAISQRQSWFNPLGNLPAYWVVTGLPARAAAAALALFPLASALTVYLFARRAVFTAPGPAHAAAAAGCALVGLTGTISLATVATTHTETWLSAAIVGAAWTLTAAGRNAAIRSPVALLALAGALLGGAAGLKVTNIPYCLGGLAAAVAVVCGRPGRLPALLTFAGAGLAAFAVSGGWWYAELLARYGNPVFPFGQGLFGDSWTGPSALPPEPHRFERDHWWQLFIDPFLLAVGDHSRDLSTVMPVRDARYLIGFYGALAVAMMAARRIVRRESGEVERGFLAFAAFYGVAYVVWVAAFNIDRYALPLEWMAALPLAMVAALLGGLKRRRVASGLAAMLALTVAAERPIKSARRELGPNWFGLTVPESARHPHTLYVMTGHDALGWLTLFDRDLGAGASFVRVGGNLIIDPSHPLGRRIGAKIAGHDGPLRSLTGAGDSAVAPAELGRFGLIPLAGGCVILTSTFGPVESCALGRMPAVEGSAEAE